jgi:predicted RecB family endonuclease
VAEDALNALVRRLTALIVKIDERDTRMVERLDALQAMLEEQRTFNRQQVEINTDVKTTLARIETLVARMLPQSENGRDA